MATDYRDVSKFHNISVVDGYIGTGTIPISSAIAFALTSFTSTIATAARTFDATETDPATIAGAVATIISDLSKKGIVVASGD